jgi:hypothetical protein
LPIETQLDYIPAQYLSQSLLRDSNVNTQLTATTANPFYGLITTGTLNASKVAVAQLLTPYPQYVVPAVPTPGTPANGVVLQENPAGSSYYESLNVRLQKRLSNNLTLLNNFIWSRLTDRLAYLNDSDPAPEKRISNDSRPLRDVLAATYNLPIGRGRALNLQNRWLDGLVGGWGLSGILTLQSGPVLNWGDYIYFGGPLNYNAHQPNGTSFDTTQFVTASASQLVYNIRTFDNQFNNLRRDPTKQVDATLTKNFKIRERAYLQVRLEAFNVTNRVTFAAPTTTPTSASFGVIGSQANTPRRLESALKFVW